MNRAIHAAVILLFALSTATSVNAALPHDARAIALVDQNGAPFRIADLQGHPALVTFVATRCTDACPIANAVFDRIRAKLAREHSDARLVTITLDPAYDTPFVMGGEARRLHADSRSWIFASGLPANVRSLMTSLGVHAESSKKRGVPDEHTSFVYVLDRRARLARELLLSTTLADEAISDLRRF